jgi:hypothetical protein
MLSLHRLIIQFVHYQNSFHIIFHFLATIGHPFLIRSNKFPTIAYSFALSEHGQDNIHSMLPLRAHLRAELSGCSISCIPMTAPVLPIQRLAWAHFKKPATHCNLANLQQNPLEAKLLQHPFCCRTNNKHRISLP